MPAIEEVNNTNVASSNLEDKGKIPSISESPESLEPQLNSNNTTTQVNQIEQEKVSNSTEYLYKQNRERQKENLELQQKVEDLEAKLNKSFVRIDKVENFINKVGMMFGNFFREKGVNISKENSATNAIITEKGYLDKRPESLIDYNEYEDSLRKNGLNEQQIKERIDSIQQATNFEGEVNKLPENQIPNRGEVTYDEYLKERPTFQDFQKESISNADGNIQVAAKEVAQMRERLQQGNIQQVGKPNILDKVEQKVSQAFRPQGVNIDKENQIPKQEFSTPGDLVNAKATDQESAHAAVDMFYGSNNESSNNQE